MDSFGSPVNFQFAGRYTFETKLGAIATMIFTGLVVLSFVYYFLKWLDKSKPIIATTDFLAEDYLNTD